MGLLWLSLLPMAFPAVPKYFYPSILGKSAKTEVNPENHLRNGYMINPSTFETQWEIDKYLFLLKFVHHVHNFTFIQELQAKTTKT